MKSAPLIFLLFIIFINALGSSFGEDFKAVNCNGVDEIQCSRLKSEEGKRVNDVNAKIVSSALEGCKPVKINVYQGVKVIRTTEIVGKIGDKCKMVLAQTTMPVQQVCLLDEVAVRLMRKDPKIQTPEEQSQGRLLFTQQCSSEVVGDSNEAQQFKAINAEQMKAQTAIIANLKAQAITDLKKMIDTLKSKCSAGDKKACADLENEKRSFNEECKKQEMKEVCKGISF